MGYLFLWIFLMIVGLALLVKGADWFVDGAAGIAGKCRISPLVIGLTVVAFGTSAPELAVSVAAAAGHSTDIGVGNIVGSNIANILLILGISSLVHILPVQKNSFRVDFPVLLIASALLIGLGAWGKAISWWDGLILLAVFAAYMAYLIVHALKERKAGVLPPPEEKSPPRGKVGLWFARMEEKTWFLIVLTVVGLGMVAGGGELLVEGAKYVASYLGVPDRIIGLTVVAIGTSLPELVTSAVAAKKGETDIAVGNIIGSNIFNILLIGGVSSLVTPLTFDLATNLIDALVAFAAVLLLILLSVLGKRKLGRAAGVVMLASFVLYYVYLFVTL